MNKMKNKRAGQKARNLNENAKQGNRNDIFNTGWVCSNKKGEKEIISSP
jgi:hypothetical protein